MRLLNQTTVCCRIVDVCVNEQSNSDSCCSGVGSCDGWKCYFFACVFSFHMFPNQTLPHHHRQRHIEYSDDAHASQKKSVADHKMSTRPRRRRSSTAIACIILSTIILATLTPPAAAQPEQQPQQEGNNNSSAAEQQQNSASASPPPPPTEAPQQGNRSSNARVDGALLVPSADAAAGRLVLTPPGVLAGNFSQLSAACQEQLKALNLQNSVLPVVLIQLANTSGVSASAAQLQLLAKGPSLPGLMTTCGSPGTLLGCRWSVCTHSCCCCHCCSGTHAHIPSPHCPHIHRRQGR